MKVINSLSEYIDAIDDRKSIMLKSVFRGQGNKDWELIPSFYRMKLEVYDNRHKDVMPNYSIIEETILDYFYQKGAWILQKYDIKNSLDLMVIAQHHGLPTRLIDWTENALYALFFAVEDDSIKSDACVYKYMPLKIDNYDRIALEKNFKDDKNYWFVTPRHLNERVKAQNGVFTLHPLYKKIKVDSFEKVLKNNKSQDVLQKIIIPKDKKAQIKKDLDKIGVNRFMIFPDLDGLALQIKSDFTNLPLFFRDGYFTAE